MCGIAGWYSRAGAVPRPVIAAQCNTIWHRGPDDQGTLVDADFGFGMQRLSIIDIAHGHQPITSPDGRHAIVFNGEIYNHLILRRELAALGHGFATNSDTETILCGYREWGDDVWRRLDGMFAVAIWDTVARRLTLARDPMGIKPLYVTQQLGGLAFASELKALMALPGHRFDPDPRSVHEFFSYGHIRTDRSIYAQVRTLPPGSFLTIGATGEAQVREFWRPRYHAAEPRSDADWIEQFRVQLLHSVEQHLLADVEVGAFLSGGIDSSAIVAAMRQVSGQPVKTFTIGFPIAKYDESPHAEAVARHLGCDHTTRVIDLAHARDLLPRLQRCYDEPFASASAIPTWYVSQTAREQVKVVLSGDGGDELFLGYRRHLTEHAIGRLPAALRHVARGIVAIPATPSRAANRQLARWQKAVGAAALPDGVSRFFSRTQITSPALRQRLLSRDLLDAFETPDLFERLRDEHFPDPAGTISGSSAEQFAYADLLLHLPSAILSKVDRASMANSLEVRVPLLGRTMVDWAMGVPLDMKIRGGTGKYLLREAIRPWMPEEIVDRGKQGFQIPLAEWFDGDFGHYARELWQDAGVADSGVLNAVEVDRLFAEHQDGRRDHGRFLYALSMYSLWWADRRTAGAPSTAPVAIRATAAAPANDNGPARAGATGRRRRFAAVAAAIVAGWLGHAAIGPLNAPAQAEVFVDSAVRSHHTTAVRSTLRTPTRIMHYDAAEIARATGIRMPPIPAEWRVLDVQIYPAGAGSSVEYAMKGPGGERFSIFAMKADTPAGGTPLLERRGDAQVAYWEEGDCAFAVVGSTEAKQLLRWAARLDAAVT